MKRILTAVVLIPVVLLIVVWAPLWLFAAAVALVAVLAMREYLDIAKGYGATPFRKIALIAAVIVCFVPAARSALLRGMISANSAPSLPMVAASEVLNLLYALSLTLPLWLLLVPLRRRDFRQALPDAAFTALGYAYVAIPLSLLIYLRNALDGPLLIIFLFATVWVGDAAAYYIGKNFGKHLLAPALSPKKTWEGSIASVIGSIGVATLLFFYQLRDDAVYSYTLGRNTYGRLVTSILLAIAINIAAQLGDLVESMLKRGANIKDSGSILPGHGGMLDRIDAMLFAIPVMWYYACFHAEYSYSLYSPR